MSNSPKNNTEINPFIWLLLGVMAVSYFITDKMFMSMLLSMVLTGVVAAAFYSIRSALKSIKSKTQESVGGKGEGIKKIVIWVLVLIVAISVFVSCVATSLGNASPRCINCGKNAMWTETGFCYSCYTDVKKSFKS